MGPESWHAIGKAPGFLSHSFWVLKSTVFQTAFGGLLRIVHLLAWETEEIVQALGAHKVAPQITICWDLLRWPRFVLWRVTMKSTVTPTITVKSQCAAILLMLLAVATTSKWQMTAILAWTPLRTQGVMKTCHRLGQATRKRSVVQHFQC